MNASLPTNGPKQIEKAHPALYLLPNAFTLASVFCGIYAILLCASTVHAESFQQAAIAIFLAGFFDMFDGRVARLTRTQTDFGMELDSLADTISFGVAPSVLVYKWALWEWGLWGTFIAFVFAACGIIRLARFNVLSKRQSGSSHFFVGLPIPLAAASLVSFLIAFQHFGLGTPSQRPLLVALITLSLAMLMVSKVLYWSFKKTQIDSKMSVLLFIGLGILIALTFLTPPSLVLLLLLGTYLVAGITRFLVLAAFKNRALS